MRRCWRRAALASGPASSSGPGLGRVLMPLPLPLPLVAQGARFSAKRLAEPVLRRSVPLPKRMRLKTQIPTP